MPRGRGGYAVRTGLFIKEYLTSHGEAFIEEMHRGYKAAWAEQNAVRKKVDQVKPATYESFRKYFAYLVQLGLVEFVREEPILLAPNADSFLRVDADNPPPIAVQSLRRYFRLTGRGIAEEDAWFDPQGELRRQREGIA